MVLTKNGDDCGFSVCTHCDKINFYTSKQKLEEAYRAAAKILDWSNQDEPSFEELGVAETEELAENDPGEPGDVVQMQDESENRKERGEA